MSVAVTVLGSCGGYARAGRACSGYLLRYWEETLALDLGAGALSNLLKYVHPDELGGLALSHLHYDHYVDIYGLLTARRFWPVELPPLAVVSTPGTEDVLGAPINEATRELFSSCLSIVEPGDGEEVGVAGFDVKVRRASHSVEANAMRISAGGRVVCYSGDTDYSEALLELAAGCDLLICEATFTSELPFKIPGHLQASEAGEIAQRAGAGRLLLTHVWPTLDEGRAVADAREKYSGTVEAAVEGLTVEL